MYRYLHRSNVCVNHTIQPAEDDDSPEFERDNRGYVFTVFLFGIISFLRLVEYIPLFIGLWQYWDDSDGQNNSDSCGLNEHKHYFIFVLLIPVMAISLSLPAIGLLLENRCGDASVTANVFIAYCIINFFRYAWAFSVRMGMVFATLKVKEIWKTALPAKQNGNEEPPASLTTKYRKAGEKVKKIAEIFETWFLFPWIIFFLVSSLKAKNILSLWNDEEEEVETLPLVYFLLYNINQMIFLIIPYLCVRKMNHYHHQCVEKIQEQQLNPGREDGCVAEQRKLQVDEKYDVEPRERIQGQQLNPGREDGCVAEQRKLQVDENYDVEPRERIQGQQLNPGREDGCVAEQRKLQVDEKYDVEPRVWGLGFKVKIKGFVYTLFLITGLVFTILTPLL